ncbi:hypothetical protein CLOP_g5761 [Closterium sp. NIES-67]|nr:hypothetical protein CLOP_g5761 [Closterium sp. NIES-67]
MIRRLATVAAGSCGKRAVRALSVANHAHGTATSAVEGGASFHSSATANAPEPTASSGAQNSVPFPREGPGVSYALNWSLAAAGVTPAGLVQRNVKPSKLGAAAPAGSKAPARVAVKGSKDLSKADYNKLLKEVTAHLSSLPSVFVQDGAVGSASLSDVRTRAICDSPAAAAAMAALLCPTPTRTLAADSFPLTAYVAPNFKTNTAGDALIAVDWETSSLVVTGAAVADAASIQAVLAAAAGSAALKKGALLLNARFISAKPGSCLLLSPPSAASVLPKSSAFPEDSLLWSAGGVARLFPGKDASAPNLYVGPNAVVLLTSDSSKVLPPVLKLSPKQAAFYFLAGYDGAAFNPAFAPPAFAPKPAAAALAAAAGGAAPLALALKLAEQLEATSTPAYLINTFEEQDPGKLVHAAISGKIPAAKKPTEEALTTLRSKFDAFIKGRFPDLPEDISPL